MAEKNFAAKSVNSHIFCHIWLWGIVLLHDATLDQEPDTGLCLPVNRKFVDVLPEIIGDIVFPLWYMKYIVYVSSFL